jgi:hypothetical protein
MQRKGQVNNAIGSVIIISIIEIFGYFWLEISLKGFCENITFSCIKVSFLKLVLQRYS